MEVGEHIEGLGLGDVPRVDHPVDSRCIEQLDDAADVAQVVVGVADDADSHGRGEA